MKWFNCSVVFLLFCFSVTVYPSRGDDMDSVDNCSNKTDITERQLIKSLLSAAKTNDVETFKNILTFNKDLINMGYKQWRYLLLVAAMKGSLDVIKYLVEEQHVNVDVVYPGYTGSTPLYEAVKAEKLEAVKLLIELGADKNKTYKNNSKLLHVAAIKGNVEVLKVLLPFFNIDVRNDLDATPAYLAASEGKLEALQFLLKNGADPYARRDNGNTLMHAAVLSGQVDVVRELTPYKQLINVPTKYTNTPIEFHANMEVVKELVDAGAIISNSTIFMYIGFNEFDIVKYLVIKSGKVNARIKWHTNSSYQESLLMYLLDKEPLPYDMIKFILDQGADVNIKCYKDETALHRAASIKHEKSLQIIKLLLDKGADVNAPDVDGCTPLDYARRHGNHDVIKYLSTFGAVTRDNTGKDALGSTTGDD